MSVTRRVNILSQLRIDSPALKSIESAVSNDFDDLIKSFVTGTSQGYILRGFNINMAGAIGGAASALQLVVDPGAIFHIASSQSGTFHLVASGTANQQLNSATNTIVDGSFAPSSINYVGLEYERFIDATTSAQSYFWNPTQDNETTKSVPQATILRYRIKITTRAFATTVLPIATVTTDAGNNVTTIVDARWNLFRLASGGATPNPFRTFTWSQGRLENASSSTSNSIDPFYGGDKSIGTLKDWMDAIMSSIQEIKGTVYWYQPGTAGSIESLRTDLGNTITTGKGAIAHSSTTAGRVNWDEDIFMKVAGSRIEYKITANPATSDITLADNQIAYFELTRDVEITPNIIFTNASAILQSVGAVAWTSSLQAGDWVKLAADSVSGYYKILTVDSLSQVTLTIPYTGSSTGAPGAKAKYAFGSYQTAAVPSTARHIYVVDREDMPEGQNIWWFLLRADNAGVVPRVYVRFLGTELEQGETQEIDDGVPRQLLEYIGSPLESSRYPQYSSAINPGAVAEITDLQIGAAATITSNQYFFLNSSADARQYYVWFNKDGTGVDPAPSAFMTGIEVAITTGDTAIQVAVILAAAINGTTFDDFTAAPRANPNDDTVRVTNNSGGTCTNASNFDVGSLTVSLVQNGTGDGNYVVNDGDNLTAAIKKLDEAYGLIIASLDDPSYDETVDIVAAGEVPPTSINGPTLVAQVFTLPLNTRTGSVQQYYTVGQGTLQVFLNGQYLRLGTDWTEVGSASTASDQIAMQQVLVAGDVLEFRIVSGGIGTGGGGATGPQGPAGPAGADSVGGPVAISTKIADYTFLTTDNIILGDATALSIVITLPPAATCTGQIFFLKKIDATGNTVTLKGDGVELIDGLNTKVISAQYDKVMVVSSGSQFWTI